MSNPQVKVLASRRAERTRSTLHGSAERPRLSVHISNLHVSAQLIDDDNSKTLVSASTVAKKISGTMTDKAKQVGVEIAKKAAAKKIKRVIFDRGARNYHGRVKALADAARENGLEF